MLSITHIKDFIDLDGETVNIVAGATGLSDEESVALARQFLASEEGLLILHHMYRDQIAAVADDFLPARAETLRAAYAYFSRKYPLPALK